MAKNITTFVKSIGANRVAAESKEISRCYWDFVPRNSFHDDRACVNFHHEQFFCVPAGICCVRFEIWGAGGPAMGDVIACTVLRLDLALMLEKQLQLHLDNVIELT